MTWFCRAYWSSGSYCISTLLQKPKIRQLHSIGLKIQRIMLCRILCVANKYLTAKWIPWIYKITSFQKKIIGNMTKMLLAFAFVYNVPHIHSHCTIWIKLVIIKKDREMRSWFDSDCAKICNCDVVNNINVRLQVIVLLSKNVTDWYTTMCFTICISKP